jgi:hypothetical protein
MREFLFLDAKRKVAGLSSVEEQRWIDLGQLLGIEHPKPNVGRPLDPVAGYYGPDGNWYPYSAEPNSSAWIPPDWDAYRAAQKHTGFNGLTYPPNLVPPPSAFEADPSQPAGYQPPAQEPLSDALTPPPTTTADSPLSDAAIQTDPSDVLEADPADVLLLDPGVVEPSTASAAQTRPEIDFTTPSPTIQSVEMSQPVAEPDDLTNHWDANDAAFEPPEWSAEPLNSTDAVPPSLTTVDSAFEAAEAAIDDLNADLVTESSAPTNDLERSAEPLPPVLAPAPSLGQPPVLNAEPPSFAEFDDSSDTSEWSAEPLNSTDAVPLSLTTVDSAFEAAEAAIADLNADLVAESSAPTNDLERSAEPFPPVLAPAPSLGQPPVLNPEPPLVQAADALDPEAANGAEPPLIDLLDSDADDSKVLPFEMVEIPTPESLESSPRAPTLDLEGGDQRIVLHMMDGRVKRGLARELSLMAEAIPIEVRAGGPTEEIPVEQVKTIFFMLAPGAERPVPHGEKIRVMFHDGREIVGYSSDFKSSDRGFFLVPADARSNTGKVYLFRWSVHDIRPM